jgi:hypothetical protein
VAAAWMSGILPINSATASSGAYLTNLKAGVFI